MSNKTLLEDLSALATDDFPLPSTSIGENNTFPIDEGGNLTTTPRPFQVPEIVRFIDRNPWVVYLIIITLTLIVIAVVCLLLKALCRKKKQVIQQDDDPVLTSTYDDGTSNIFYRLLCCRPKHDANSMRMRQNSESNLDPYKRPPLPPIGMKEGDFHYISPFAGNGLSQDEKIFASSITGIRGVSHQPQRSEHYRALPQLRLNEADEMKSRH